MPVHYVDTFLGSDANTGASWSSPWKTLRPVGALYTGSTVEDVEVRLAKTDKLGDRALTFSQPVYDTQGYVAGTATIGAPQPDVRQIGGSNTQDINSSANQLGLTAVAPFSSNYAFSSGGHFMKILFVPDASSGRAFFRTISGVFLIETGAIELWLTVNSFNPVSVANMTATLHLCSDIQATISIASYPLVIGTCQGLPVLNVIGQGTLPSGVNGYYIHLSMSGNGGSARELLISQIIGVPPVGPGYFGFRTFMVPNHDHGQCLEPTAVGPTWVTCIGMENSKTNAALTLERGVTPTWAVYPWEPVSDLSVLFPAVATLGTPTAPFKVLGGFDKATGLRTGLTCIDAQHIKLAGSTLFSHSVHLSDLAIAGHRMVNSYSVSRDTIAIAGIPGNYVPRGVRGSHNQITRCYTSVRGQTSAVNTPVGRTTDIQPIMGSTLNNEDNLDYQSVVDGGTYYGPPISGRFGGYARPTHTNCTVVYSASGGTYSNCKFLEITGRDGDITATNCGSWAANAGSLVPSGGALVGTFTDCEFHGTQAISAFSTLVRPVFHTYRYLPGPCIGDGGSGAVLSMTDIRVGPYRWAMAGSMFSIGAYRSVLIEGSTFGCSHAGLLSGDPAARDISAAGTLLTGITGSQITALNPSPASVVSSTSTVLASMHLMKVSNSSFIGNWASVFSGGLPRMSVQSLTTSSPTTKLVDVYSFNGDPFGSGDVSAAFTGLSLATPAPFGASQPVPKYSSACYRTSSEEILFNTCFSVKKNLSLKTDGEFSWEFLALLNIGSPIIGSLRVGVISISAGLPLTIGVMVRRDNAGINGGVILRPLRTKAYDPLGPEVILHDLESPPPILLNEWEYRQIVYTPDNTGMCEVYLSIYGIAGGRVFFDGFSLDQ